jgi:dipeptidyl aminopeptidase/acylaminoacyl peptidase
MVLSRTAFCSIVALCLVIISSAQSQTPPTVAAADYARAEKFLPHKTAPLIMRSVGSPTWLPDDTLWYRTTTAAGSEFVHVDPAQGTRTSCSIRNDDCWPPATPNADESISPDKKRAVFIRDYNLWARDLASGRETQLTTDGVKDFGYATDNPGWEHSNRAIVTWSQDSKKLASFRQDQRGVGDMYLVKTKRGHPELETWKYAMAGDPVIATIQRVIIDVDSRRVVRLNVPPDPHRSSPCYDVQCGDGNFADVQWSPDGSRLAFVSTSRDHKHARLRIADATTGAVREVLEETSPTFYESDISSTSHGAVNWRYLPKSNEIIWFSERDDRAHLYLYNLRTGKLRHRITSGNWDVVELLKVDDKSRMLYLLGVGREKNRDPYFVHLYKVAMDGGKTTLLTPEDANHDITLAPSGRYFVDSYSRPDIPPVTVLRDREGKLLSTLERADISRLVDAGWKPPVAITVMARDGVTELYGLMFKPTNFDESRRYPIIDWIYPGPQIGSVGSRSFAASRGDRQALAELGFVVVAIDGMGTPFRSKTFHDVYYNDMRDNSLPDQVTGMTQLARRYPWIDLDRVGIYGHSGGGYAAAAALFTYPDFFKVGISESGNHDQRGYTDDWGEKFATAFEKQDNESIVKNLKGHLLLSHGTMDDNVPPYLTLLLVNSLIKANKDFDLVILPNQRHPYRSEADTYMTRRRWDYFVRNLLGVDPPHEYELHSGTNDVAE